MCIINALMICLLTKYCRPYVGIDAGSGPTYSKLFVGMKHGDQTPHPYFTHQFYPIVFYTCYNEVSL